MFLSAYEFEDFDSLSGVRQGVLFCIAEPRLLMTENGGRKHEHKCSNSDFANNSGRG